MAVWGLGGERGSRGAGSACPWAGAAFWGDEMLRDETGMAAKQPRQRSNPFRALQALPMGELHAICVLSACYQFCVLSELHLGQAGLGWFGVKGYKRSTQRMPARQGGLT